MKKIQEINDICKEVLTILAFFNENLIERIPAKVFKNLSKLAADSKLDFYIDKEKDLDEEDISEESKDLISLIYYDYIASEDEKNEIAKLWNQNEYKYQEYLKEIYNSDNLFKNKKIENKEVLNECNAMVKYKENLFKKIMEKLKSMFTKKLNR